MHLRHFALAVSFLFLSPFPVFAADPPPTTQPLPIPRAEVEITPELDAYYTNIGIHIPLTNQPISDVGESDELKVYSDLFRNSLTPRFLLLEASVFPMPVLGTYLKKNNRSFYDSSGFSDDFNLIGSITAGFQEPYSFSLFFGDVVTFVKPGEQRNGSNKGYMGYLFTFADQHIKNNQLINDKSLEIEWKMKGERNFSDEKLNWSFRLGTKIHDNPDIADVMYLGLRRSNLDFKSSALSWLKNSSFDFRWDFGLKGAGILRQEYIIGKKLPFKNYNMALKLDVGMIWQNNKYYSGGLRDKEGDRFTFVFRPNLEF
ncbi:MAG: hypothetical protein HXX17_11450 [Geobacteraceae bacterium]|nr:hypothetical protein [Geobacteraceae bacterium]